VYDSITKYASKEAIKNRPNIALDRSQIERRNCREDFLKIQDALMDALSVISELNKTIYDLRQDLKRKDREINDIRRLIEEMNQESSTRHRESYHRQRHSKSKTKDGNGNKGAHSESAS